MFIQCHNTATLHKFRLRQKYDCHVLLVRNRNVVAFLKCSPEERNDGRFPKKIQRTSTVSTDRRLAVANMHHPLFSYRDEPDTSRHYQTYSSPSKMIVLVLQMRNSSPAEGRGVSSTQNKETMDHPKPGSHSCTDAEFPTR